MHNYGPTSSIYDTAGKETNLTFQMHSVYLNRCIQICTFFTSQMVYKFVHPWPPRWCTNLCILDFSEDVQICTSMTSKVVCKFVHPWAPVSIKSSRLTIANYLFICDTGLHRTMKKQKCWWCWSFNSECWWLVAVFCENYAQEPVIGQCTQIFDNTIEVMWMEGSYTSLWKPGRCEMPKIVGK